MTAPAPALPWTTAPMVDPSGIPAEGLPSPFQAPWTSTVELLRRELGYLRAERTLLEVQALGLTALGALDVAGPRVRLSFDSRWGPLSYATGRYGTDGDPVAWRWNVRAIALGLESLRRVDRYGITPNGEQYRGWVTAPVGEPAASARALLELAGVVGVSPTQVVADVGTFRRVYRAAARRHDPDAGADLTGWHRLQRARTVLSDHHGADA